MLAAKRKDAIKSLLLTHDGCSLATLAQELNVSKSTIYRDVA
ncbi:MAG: HTH domain-containing protein, partial [Oscillospiraceae bacterium]|nr:HTH domain-containing protein [Oscillospiraceae bacterium]